MEGLPYRRPSILGKLRCSLPGLCCLLLLALKGGDCGCAQVQLRKGASELRLCGCYSLQPMARATNGGMLHLDWISNTSRLIQESSMCGAGAKVQTPAQAVCLC